MSPPDTTGIILRQNIWKYKSWYVEHVIPDEELLREDLFIEHAADIFRRNAAV